MHVLDLIQPFIPLRQMRKSFSQQLHWTPKLPLRELDRPPECSLKEQESKEHCKNQKSTYRERKPCQHGGEKEAFPSGMFTFNQVPCKQLCLQDEWADVGSKQMLKLGALSAHRQAIFKLRTQKQTLVMWVCSNAEVRLPANTDWVGGPDTVHSPVTRPSCLCPSDFCWDPIIEGSLDVRWANVCAHYKNPG